MLGETNRTGNSSSILEHTASSQPQDKQYAHSMLSRKSVSLGKAADPHTGYGRGCGAGGCPSKADGTSEENTSFLVE